MLWACSRRRPGSEMQHGRPVGGAMAARWCRGGTCSRQRRDWRQAGDDGVRKQEELQLGGERVMAERDLEKDDRCGSGG